MNTLNSTDQTLLRMEGVEKSFPGVRALAGVRLDLRHDEVLALVGENGAGKSTMMKLLSGIYQPDAGSFFIDGELVHIGGPRHAQELGVSIIHQEFNLMPDLSVAQNIYIGREPRAGQILLRESAMNKMATDLLERLELPLDPRIRVGDLTVATQQMVEIAKALSYEARILIMDEPTAALNDAEVETLHGLIRRFKTPQTGVIYISHRMDELKAISDRITVIRDGHYIDTLDTQQTTMREVIKLMVGREIGASTPPHVENATDKTVLEVRGLGTTTLLHDVSFELKKGEILGFAGLLGAGRTELARAIVGADKTETGSISVSGKKVTIRNPAEAARLGIGYLSEDRKRYGLLLERDVNANIGISSLARYSNRFGFINDKAVKRKSEQLISELRIKTPSSAQIAKNLSGGNQQKIVIAKWLLKDCDILIFDEPTRGIDVGAKEEIYKLLNQLTAQGKSIIMISSELPEVLRMSHRIAVMCEGKLTKILNSDEADQETIMHYATLRPDILGVHEGDIQQEVETK